MISTDIAEMKCYVRSLQCFVTVGMWEARWDAKEEALLGLVMTCVIYTKYLQYQTYLYSTFCPGFATCCLILIMIAYNVQSQSVKAGSIINILLFIVLPIQVNSIKLVNAEITEAFPCYSVEVDHLVQILPTSLRTTQTPAMVTLLTTQLSGRGSQT